MGTPSPVFDDSGPSQRRILLIHPDTEMNIKYPVFSAGKKAMECDLHDFR
jgi:hypothetical protein